MKSVKITLLALFVSALSFAQTLETKPSVEKTAQVPTQSLIKWQEEVHDFGTIEKGVPATYEFTFVNPTNETILITNVKPACGCTAANYTKTPIKPGEKGTVQATYNAASPGKFHKTVTVSTSENGGSIKTLSFKGEVIDLNAPKKEEIKS